MTEIIISYRPERENPPRNAARRLSSSDGSFLLNPGTRTYDAAIRKHPSYQGLVQIGAIVEKSPEEMQASGEASIANLSIEDAEPLIEREDDAALLRKWRDEDSRKGIKNLIARRLEEIANGLA